jgi:hypothetical protein
VARPATALPVSLAPHDSLLVLMSAQPWAEIPKRLG